MTSHPTPPGRPTPPGLCPTCRRTLPARLRRRLTLLDATPAARDAHLGPIARAGAGPEHLLAFSCGACGALVPARGLGDPLRHLAAALFFTPGPEPVPAAAWVTPTLCLGTPGAVATTAVSTPAQAVAVVRAGGVAALPAGAGSVAAAALALLGACEHRVAAALAFAGVTGAPAPAAGACDCVQDGPPRVLAPAEPVDPIGERTGDLGQLRAALSTAELREHARYWAHRRTREPSAYGRWWCSKLLSAAQRDLAERGEDPHSWRQSAS